jgi:hypothetical protein
MADATPKVFAAIPPGYWDLPGDERLVVAEELAGQLQDGLPQDGAG